MAGEAVLGAYAEKHFTITGAIHFFRLKEARAMLIASSKNINEIAMACGFADTDYFRRLFKRNTDMTPKQFRTLYCRTHVNTH